jgi:hypothetical protein
MKKYGGTVLKGKSGCILRVLFYLFFYYAVIKIVQERTVQP